MHYLLVSTILLAALPVRAAEPQHLTQADLLLRLIDLDRLMTPPGQERSGMFSSYDRRSRLDEAGEQVDWDANADRGQFIRTESDGWQVMAELDGPGAITRIWSANPEGELRIVLDDQTVVDAPFADLFGGKLPPFAEPLCYVTPGGGNNCYFPIGYSRSCQVAARGSTSYYQINYVALPADAEVERFTPELSTEAQAALAQVAQALQSGLSDRQLFHGQHMYPVADFAELKRNEKLTIDTIAGGGIIRALFVSLTDRRLPTDPYALHRCVLRIFVDGEKQPSVEVPLIDFFGSGFGPRFYRSLVIGTDLHTSMPGEMPKESLFGGAETGPPLAGEVNSENRFMYCYFPIPFRDAAQVEIENLSGEKSDKIGLMLLARVDRASPPADAARFHARFRREDPCQELDYPILETTGPGRIVGCVLNVDCPRAAWWGEGDDNVWIDGEAFPSYFGTGSEDFLGDAWGLHVHTSPLQGATRAGAYGKASGFRWLINDCIDFHQSVRFTIENWQHEHAQDTYYGTVAYWYGDARPVPFFPTLALGDLAVPPLRIPAAVEVEGHVVGEGWGNVIREKYADGVELSGQQAANITTDQPVQIIIPSDRERIIRLKLRVHPRRAFETITVTDAGGRTVGTVKYERATEGIYTIGVLHLQAGDNLVRVRCVPKAILDCWILEDVPQSTLGPEGEHLPVRSESGVESSIEYGTLDWSGGAQRVLDFKAPASAIKFALPPIEPPGPRRVRLVITRGPAGGRYRALLDDQPLGEPFDAFAPQPGIERVDLGAVSLNGGPHVLGFVAEKPSPPSSAAAAAPLGGRLGLDVVELVRIASLYAYECEALPVVGSQNTSYEVQDIAGTSGGAHVWCRPTEPGAWIEFELPVRKPGRYRLAIQYTSSFDYGIVQTYVNGEQAGEPFDTFGPLEAGPVRPLGVIDLPAAPLRIRAEVVGKSDQSPGYYFGVDCIIVEPE